MGIGLNRNVDRGIDIDREVEIRIDPAPYIATNLVVSFFLLLRARHVKYDNANE